MTSFEFEKYEQVKAIQKGFLNEIAWISSQKTYFNKHDASMCGAMHSAKLRNHNISIPDNTSIGNTVYNNLKINHHSKVFKDRKGAKGTNSKNSNKNNSCSKIKTNKYEIKPKYKDKRR
uniref:Uncharacterized protein n=1 Tax=viral metagenome TaxID=1070528 RepID=A0A6C0J8C4_9ZZZZ